MPEDRTNDRALHAPLSLRQNFSWNFFGNVVYAACQWGVLVVLAKLTNPEMVGRFALGLAITAPIMVLSQLQLRGVQATDVCDQYAFGNYLALRISTTAIGLLLIVAIAFLGGYSLHKALVIVAVGLSKASESFADILYGLLQRHERMDGIARSRMIKGPLSLLAISVVVFLTRDVLCGVIALVVVSSATVLTYDCGNARAILRELRTVAGKPGASCLRAVPVFELRSLLQLARNALPLGIVMGLISLRSNIPPYFIERHCGTSALGIFGALACVVIAGNTVVTAIGQACLPRLAQYYSRGEARPYCRLLLRLLAIGTIIGGSGVLVAAVGSRPLLTLIYSREYAEHTSVFVGLMIAGGLMYLASFLTYGMIATRYYKAQLPLVGVVVAVATGFCAWFMVPRIGLMGGVYSLIVGMTAQIAGNAAVILHALRCMPARPMDAQ